MFFPKGGQDKPIYRAHLLYSFIVTDVLHPDTVECTAFYSKTAIINFADFSCDRFALFYDPEISKKQEKSSPTENDPQCQR